MKLSCSNDQLLASETVSISERLDFWDFDDLPILPRTSLPEKLKTVTVNFNGTPGMSVNQLGKVFFDAQLLIAGQSK